MICYHNLGEIAHDVVTACPVRIGIKKRARCCDYWELCHRLLTPPRMKVPLDIGEVFPQGRDGIGAPTPYLT